MNWQLFGAIIVVIAAYFIGRLSGRAAEAREQRGAFPPSQPRGAKPQKHKRPTFTPTEFTDLTEEQVATIRAELMANRKISAIKIARELTGYGLKEAKDYVESLER